MSLKSLTPYLTVSNAKAAIEFYKAAFGAEEVARHAAPNGDKLMHARLMINDHPIMLADDFPEYANGARRTPEALGGSPVVLAFEVDNADEAWNRALAAGARVKFPLKDQFWGERYGQLVDPFGHIWSMSQVIREVSAEEATAGAERAFAEQDERNTRSATRQ